VWLYKNSDFKDLCAEVYKEQTNLPGLNLGTSNAEYYTCGTDPVLSQIKSVKLKKESVVMVYKDPQRPDFADPTGEYRALRTDIVNTQPKTTDAKLDLNPFVDGEQGFWSASPLTFSSIEIPAGFRVSLYSNTAMRDRCAVLTKKHETIDPSIGNEADFLSGKNSEYYSSLCSSDGVKSIRISAGATEQPGLVSLFEKKDFDGTAREVNANAPLINVRINSLKLNPPTDCDHPDDNCQLYAVVFERNNFFGKCEVFNLSKEVFSFNVGSLMVIRASLKGEDTPPEIKPALTLYEDVNLNEGKEDKGDGSYNHTTTEPIHAQILEKTGTLKKKGDGDSAWQSPKVRTIIFEKDINTLHLNGELKGKGGLCEGLTSQEKDVLRLRNKTNGAYIFRLK
jgi:hypothetical protein